MFICFLFDGLHLYLHFVLGEGKTGKLQFGLYLTTELKSPTRSTQGEEDDLEKHFTAECLGSSARIPQVRLTFGVRRFGCLERNRLKCISFYTEGHFDFDVQETLNMIAMVIQCGIG